MKIIVTPEEMRSNATSLRSEKANFEQCISSMRTIVNSMSGVFEGEAAAAYVSNFESYCCGISGLCLLSTRHLHFFKQNHTQLFR